ncbi:MAG TPA: TrpB-like pyridoxal phosphate-dependent enzyme, partial [Vicinamibacterales bacterium]
MTDTKITLPEREIPTHFYNIAPDLPTPLSPPLHPATRKPVGPEDLAPIFPSGLIAQEMSREPMIEIPDEVRDIYRLYRPTPMFRARAFEEALDTPARIYYKSEHVSPVGSHKLNTAIMQAYVNKQEGVRRLATETGAGQWGSALACACRLIGLECMVYMVRISYDQKPYRRIMMKTYGADVVASPSNLTATGRAMLAEDSNTPGSLGMAISEAVEDAAQRDDTKYALGSVLNHVLLHQTIIGQEAKKQMELAGDYPDILIACHGGGSNFGGLTFPFLKDKLSGARPSLRAIAVEPTSCPSLTRGRREYDFGDTAGMTPLMMMHTLGHAFMPAPVHAGGLRYHGSSPIVSHLLAAGVIEAEAYDQHEVF